MSGIGNYYTGGLAEIVSSPSKLTYLYLAEWFTGAGSLGKAMELLHLPYRKVGLTVLVMKDDDLVVDLTNEEKTLYADTIFKYSTQDNIHDTPKLVVNITKLFNPLCVINTLKIVGAQSRWIANYKKTVKIAQSFVDDIPEKADYSSADDAAKFLEDKVWPNVIAVGMLCEFFNTLLVKESGDGYNEIAEYVSSSTTEKDWFFRSIADREKVKHGDLKFSRYMKRYGIRGDVDYELTSPRWNEEKEKIKDQISKSKEAKQKKVDIAVADKNTKKLADALVELQILRSEAKRKTLVHFAKLREYTKDSLSQKRVRIKRRKRVLNEVKNGRGVGISKGRASGKILNIVKGTEEIPEGTVGVFPNASPQFSYQYPKCVGLIFLRGGMTSHGAIVAREFGVPALVDAKADGFSNGVKVRIDGLTGKWKVN